MALFDTKKKETKAPKQNRAPKAPKAKKPRAPKKTGGRKGGSERSLADAKLERILAHPWMSEKALIGTERGVYVFAVPADATKRDIILAVERFYKVVPVKVNVVRLPAKRKPMRRKRGMGARAARHKAYVYLKKGETITF